MSLPVIEYQGARFSMIFDPTAPESEDQACYRIICSDPCCNFPAYEFIRENAGRILKSQYLEIARGVNDGTYVVFTIQRGLSRVRRFSFFGAIVLNSRMER